ncbi:MAG: peptidoglycan editing factor PgeF [Clostridia bacterium]|nr:peptidoglycan editing factor PgeF [Clostridia bacterium]
MPDFRLVEKDGIVTLKCCKFEEFQGINHGFSTRHGGVSTGDCASLSFSYNKEPEAIVDENFRRFSVANRLPFESLVLTHQTHTANVAKVDENYVNQGRHRKLRDTDGLVTATPGLGLCCFTADCVPVLLADPIHKVVAAVHSGWRGTVGGIAANAVQKMVEKGAVLENIYAAIGPSIGPCCFEVGPEVQAEFDRAFGTDFPIRPSHRKGHTMVDLWRANERVLETVGITNDRIFTAKICTLCNNRDFFSHRYTSGRRGSLVAAIAIEEEA